MGTLPGRRGRRAREGLDAQGNRAMAGRLRTPHRLPGGQTHAPALRMCHAGFGGPGGAGTSLQGPWALNMCHSRKICSAVDGRSLKRLEALGAGSGSQPPRGGRQDRRSATPGNARRHLATGEGPRRATLGVTWRALPTTLRPQTSHARSWQRARKHTATLHSFAPKLLLRAHHITRCSASACATPSSAVVSGEQPLNS